MSVVTIKVDGASLVAEVAGSGECAVLLHAGVADRRMWRTTCAALSPHFRTIAYDRRGFGGTASPDEAFRHVDDLDAVLEHSGCGSAHLVGCSQGGRIAIDYALAKPEKVLSLVLAAPALTGAPAPESFPDAIERLMQELEEAENKNDIDKVNALEAHLWLDGPLSPANRVSGSIRDLFLDMNGRALRHPPLTKEQSCASATDQLHRLKQPALVICGDRDFPHIQERSQWIAGQIAGARHFVMAGCAHLANLEQPAVFNDAVRKFYAQATGLGL
jgi:pimeloyl-ACP methyl ester carboxylesterase